MATIALFVLCSAASKDLAIVTVEGDLAFGSCGKKRATSDCGLSSPH